MSERYVVWLIFLKGSRWRRLLCRRCCRLGLSNCVAQCFFQSLFNRVNPFLADLVSANRFRDDGQQVVNVRFLLVTQRLSMLLQYAIGFFECFCSHFISLKVFSSGGSHPAILELNLDFGAVYRLRSAGNRYSDLVSHNGEATTQGFLRSLPCYFPHQGFGAGSPLPNQQLG